MALANYTDLQASIASWLNREDLTAQIPDFIALAESTIASEVRLRDMIKTVTVTTTGAESVSLPSDWLEFSSVVLDGKPIDYAPNDEILRNPSTTVQYTIEGGSLVIAPTPASGVPVKMTYYARTPALSVTPTNAILTKHPQIYLCRAIAWAWAFVMEPAKSSQWEAMYQMAKDLAESAEVAANVSGSPLTIRTR